MDKLSEYINNIHPPLTGALGELQQDAEDRGIPIIDPVTMRFLSTVLALKRPKDVLEIGCAIGFSAGLFSMYLADGGHITTIDRYDIMIAEAKRNFEKLGITDKVTLLEGNATDILPGLSGSYDFIFLDAAKGQYLQMLPDCIRLLKSGGIFIADDILQSGRVAKDRLDVPKRQRTIHTRLRQFLEQVVNYEGIEASILPVDDGVLFAVKGWGK